MEDNLRNLKVMTAYRGTNYHGFQRQSNALTVQEVLERCVSKVLNEPVTITGCSRTDTGVHANRTFHWTFMPGMTARERSTSIRCTVMSPKTRSPLTLHSTNAGNSISRRQEKRQPAWWESMISPAFVLTVQMFQQQYALSIPLI